MHTTIRKYILIFLILFSGTCWGQRLKSSKEKELLYSLVLENLNQYSNVPYHSKFQVSESIFGSLRNYLINKGDEDYGADTLARLVDSPKWAYIKTLNMNNMIPWSQSIVTRKDYLRNKKISTTENKTESVFLALFCFLEIILPLFSFITKHETIILLRDYSVFWKTSKVYGKFHQLQHHILNDY